MSKGSRELTSHHEIRVHVLGLEMVDDLRIRAGVVAEPVVVVAPHVAEELHVMLYLLGDGRLRPGRHDGGE